MSQWGCGFRERGGPVRSPSLWHGTRKDGPRSFREVGNAPSVPGFPPGFPSKGNWRGVLAVGHKIPLQVLVHFGAIRHC